MGSWESWDRFPALGVKYEVWETWVCQAGRDGEAEQRTDRLVPLGKGLLAEGINAEEDAEVALAQALADLPEQDWGFELGQ